MLHFQKYVKKGNHLVVTTHSTNQNVRPGATTIWYRFL